MKYDPKQIEPKWQKYWEENKTFAAKEYEKKKKFFALIEFPYPSGAGLHIGHQRPFTAMDVISRKKRMQGENVMYPMGFDAFGLPTENYAIKVGRHPAEVTRENIANFTRQTKSLGFGFDWNRVVDTTDPKYFKWTQWIFLQLYKHGLAYKKAMPINWCINCKIGLANEEVVNGRCERCGGPVEKRNKKQWMLSITKYADKLIDGLKDLDFVPQVKTQQENWIGRSEGALVTFLVPKYKEVLLATNNKSKRKRMQMLFDHIGLKTKINTPEDLGIKSIEVEENGTLEENSKDKAMAYQGKTDMPIFSLDTGFFIEGTEIDPIKVKRNALEGKSEAELSQEEIAEKVLNYYKKIAEEKGGQVPAYWLDKWSLLLPDGNLIQAESKREVVLTNQAQKKIDIYFPVRSLYKVKSIGKYAIDLTEEEEMKELFPMIEVFRNLFCVKLGVFTTRPDTLFGATYMVIAPEHDLISKEQLVTQRVITPWVTISNIDEVKKYIEESKGKSDLERTELQKEKTGVELKGIKAINPATKEEIPIFVADYVLGGYGTGAIMAVPAHDERDFEFAKKYDLPIKYVVLPHEFYYLDENRNSIKIDYSESACLEIIEKMKNVSSGSGMCYCSVDGVMVNSGFLNNFETDKAKEKMISWLEENKIGKKQIQYKLRDWVFSRQRYWGEPIPLVHCENCEKKKQKVLLIHGFESSGEGNWLGWMKNELEKQGFEVFNPTMSTSKNPDVKKWTEELLPYIEKMGENDIVVAHSLGSKAALHLIEKADKKIGYVFLIASAIGTQDKRDWDELKTKWPNSDIKSLKKFWEAKIDWKKISSLVYSKNLVISKDDPFVKLETHQNLPQGWYVNVWDGFKHFQKSQILELLELVLTAKNTGWVPLEEGSLPLELPSVEKYEPTDTGESPLSEITDWVNVKCPVCGGLATRETDTMPNWAGSSWYFLRYCDSQNNNEMAAKEKLDYWMPVDWYNGGMEHVTLHLLYSRFWNQFLYDIGYVPFSEPYKKRSAHGMILAKDGQKMSKSKGNVINPDEMVEQYGADALRTYIMFMGPFDQAVAWDTNGLVGVRRFIEKIWNLQDKLYLTSEKSKIESILHQTIKKVTEDIEVMRFNTAVAQMMILVNEMGKEEKIEKGHFEILIKLLSPFAPHMCEELWNLLGNKGSVAGTDWPEYNPELAKEEKVTLAIQVNGKLRDTIEVDAGISEEEAKNIALNRENIIKWLEGKEPKKIIYIKGKLVSIVV